ncbi:hypothetical protein [Devosia sp. DBB001]|nr:hypothetical protein [Devosia sp. DBB001]
MGGGNMCLSRDDIDWMRRAMDSFEREAIFEDGREAVVYRRHSKPLEVD